MVLTSDLDPDHPTEGQGRWEGHPRWAQRAQSPKQVVHLLHTHCGFSFDGDAVAGREPCRVDSEAQGAGPRGLKRPLLAWAVSHLEGTGPRRGPLTPDSPLIPPALHSSFCSAS